MARQVRFDDGHLEALQRYTQEYYAHFFKVFWLERGIPKGATRAEKLATEQEAKRSQAALETHLRQECWPHLHKRSESLVNIDDQKLVVLIKKANRAAEIEYWNQDPTLENARKYLLEAEAEMKAALDVRGTVPPSPKQQANQLIAQALTDIEIEKAIQDRCDQEVKQNPAMEQEIRTKFRKVLDALREEA